MLPERLIIKNFLNFESADIDFSGVRKALIVGVRERNPDSSNGSGKSNLLRAIPWCLWGVNPETKTMDENIKWGSDFCSVSMLISHGGHNASVTRTRSSKSKSSTLDFMIDDVVSNGNSIEETNKRIIGFLNLDYNTYINSVYINQNDLNSLANSKDKNESREILERVLGLDEYDDYEEAAKRKIEEIKTSNKKLLDELELKRVKLSDIEMSLSKKSEIEDSIKINVSKKIELEDALLKSTERYNMLKASTDSSDAAMIEIAETKELLVKNEAELEDLTDKANAFKKGIDEKKMALSKLIETYDASVSEKKDFEKMVSVNSDVSDKIKALETVVSEANTAKSAMADEALKLKQRLGVLQHLGKSIRERISELEGKKSNPSITIGSRCDHCYGEIKNDAVEHYVKHIDDTISEFNLSIAAHKSEALLVNKDISAIDSKMAVLNSEIDKANKTKSELAGSLLSEAAIKYQRNIIDGKLSSISVANDELIKINASDEIVKWKTTIIKKRELISGLKERVEKLSAENSIDDKYFEKIAIAEAEKENLAKISSEITMTLGMMFALESKLGDLIEAQMQFDTIKKEMDGISESIVSFESTNKIYVELARAFSPKGIRNHILSSAIEDLEREANLILPQISTGNLSIRFETKKETKGKSGESEKLTFDAYINDGEKDLPFSSYSGGEQLRISFVIRVALSKLLLKRANSELELLVLDESLSALDKEGIEQMIQTINTLQSHFKKIIVITHRDDVKQYFDEVITVRREKHTSKVDLSYYTGGK